MIEKMKSNLLAGIATIIPLALTVYVIQVTLEITIWLGGTVAEPLERFVNVTFPGFGLLSSLVGLLIVLFAIIIFGALARNVFGKRVVSWFEGIFKKIPLIDTIYGTTKQIIETVSGSKNNSFKKVVYVEYPRKGSWAIGFATKDNKGEISKKTSTELVNVFVPTTPNPTSGFLLMFPKKEIIYLDMTFEEASKFIVSAGTSNPKN